MGYFRGYELIRDEVQCHNGLSFSEFMWKLELRTNWAKDMFCLTYMFFLVLVRCTTFLSSYV